MQKYPDIIIENCASGGLRMNYELLSRLSVQSVTDQEDYRLNGVIASSAATALTPEQAAFWVYPPGNADKYEIVYNLVNAMLHRFHLSGAVTEFDESSMKLIRSGIDYYKTIRSDIPIFSRFIRSAFQALPMSLWRKDSAEAEKHILRFGGENAKIMRCLFRLNKR